MSALQALLQVDQEIVERIQSFSDKLWASVDRDPREDTHAYFQYPAMMVPGIQRELIQVVRDLQPGIQNVLDPFVGAGTTMTACMSFGLSCVGQDINPLAVLVSRAKKGPFFHRALQDKARNVRQYIEQDIQDHIEASFDKLDKWFTPEVQAELSKIHRAIHAENCLWARRFFWVSLAETVRLTSNSRTSTYKLHTRPQDEIEDREVSAIETFRDIVSQNLQDFVCFADSLKEKGYLQGGHYIGHLGVYLQDSARKVFAPSGDTQQYDLLVTSPPYGDNTSTVPYGQHSYLPLQWIDLQDVDPKAVNGDWLRTTQEIDRRSLGGDASQDLDPLISHLAERSASYSTARDALIEEPPDRLARVTAFTYDLDRTLEPIIQSLRENAYMIWIVGNRHVGGIEVPTADILIELLEHKKMHFVTRAQRKIVFRRMAARNQIASMMRQEHILIFRKTGT